MLKNLFDSPRKIAYWIVSILVVLICYFVTLDRFAPSTEAAMVRAHVLMLSAPLRGTINHVYVHENEAVKKGQSLFSIDPYTNPLTNIRLSDVTVRAPENGYIARFNVALGKHVKAHQVVSSFIDNDHWWIVADVKENNLERIQPGQTALVSVNTKPGLIIKSKVQSIGYGAIATLNKKSKLPVIAKANHWINLAQRFPVVIELENKSPMAPLRVGASAVVTIYTNDDPVIHGLAYFNQWLRTKSQVFY